MKLMRNEVVVYWCLLLERITVTSEGLANYTSFDEASKARAPLDGDRAEVVLAFPSFLVLIRLESLDQVQLIIEGVWSGVSVKSGERTEIGLSKMGRQRIRMTGCALGRQGRQPQGRQALQGRQVAAQAETTMSQIQSSQTSSSSPSIQSTANVEETASLHRNISPLGPPPERVL
ncbi:hypothetical protein ACLB2K_003888 [Fragaria x ananassa]